MVKDLKSFRISSKSLEVLSWGKKKGISNTDLIERALILYHAVEISKELEVIQEKGESNTKSDGVG